ncbi:hypothetical protein [Sphaerisporangium aureirubrum]|uniref:DUF222 domain-containing protein n=1 Tax=Sphaerisporangium aureirubrum TaxID=1544736 RepID=A0ABW1ND88_9ACTN
MTEMKVEDILGQLKRPEKSVPLCLRADLQAEFDELERKLRAAQQAPDSDSLAGSGSVARQIAQDIEALRAKMRKHIVDIRLRALTRKEWSDLIKRHPPRKGHSDDVNVNGETFGIAALAECAQSPKMTEAQAGELVDAMTHGQWETLYNAVLSLNAGSVDVPFSVAASVLVGDMPRS